MKLYCLNCGRERETTNARCDVCQSESLAPTYQRLNPKEMAKVRSFVGHDVDEQSALACVRSLRVEMAFESWLNRGSTDETLMEVFL